MSYNAHIRAFRNKEGIPIPAEIHELTEFAKQAKHGSREAFSSLYALIHHDLYRFAFYALGNREDAEDAVSDAVANAYASIQHLKDPQAFKAWMFTILSRGCKSRVRQILTERKTTRIDDLYDLGTEPDLLSAIYMREQILSLNQEESAIILLCVIGGYTSIEISKMLNKPAGTIRSKCSRALDKLYHSMERNQRDEQAI